jgi:hypothetical protein
MIGYGLGDKFAINIQGVSYPIERGGLFPTVSYSYFAFAYPCPYGDCRDQPGFGAADT